MHVNKNDKAKFALILFLFIIYPISALVPIFCEIYNRKKYAFTFLALFMGLCAILYPPYADLYRHQLKYFSFATEYDSLQIITTNGLDFLLHTINNAFAQLGINFEIIRFLFTFISYQICFWIFKDIVSRNHLLSTNRKYYFITFLCVFLSIPFIWIVNGLRYTLASMFLILSIYKQFFVRSKTWIFWLILATITHFGILPIAFMQVIYKILKLIKLKAKWIFIIAILLSLTITPIILNIIDYIPLESNLKTITKIYITNTSNFTENRSLMGLIANIIERLPLLPLFYFIYKEKQFKMNYRFCLLIILLIGICQPFMILFDRITLIAMTLFTILFIDLFENIKWKKRICICLLVCFVFSNISYLYGYRDPLLKGRTYKLMYCSTPYIIFNKYSPLWIKNNLNDEGEFKKVR